MSNARSRKCFHSLDFVRVRSSTFLMADESHATMHDLEQTCGFSLLTRQDLGSWSRCRAICANVGARLWRGQEEQQLKGFAWLPMWRPKPRLRPSHQSPIRASSVWCGCWPGKRLGTSSNSKRTPKSVTACLSKEAA